MLISINRNIASLQAIRTLGSASAELAGSLERLSSGLRINKASDDAAGLSVASSLNTDTRVYTQGVRNLSDGISFLNIADGATSGLKNILFRLRELSTQASNGTYSNTQGRALDKEAQALQKEYNRIIESTSFNGVNIFQSGALTVQVGYGTNGLLVAMLSSPTLVTKGDGTFGARQAFATGSAPISVSTGDFNGDGKLDLVSADVSNNTVSVLLGNGDGTFQARQAFETGIGPHSVSTGDFNGDGKLDLVSADYNDNTVSVFLGNGDGTFQARQVFGTGSAPHSVSTGDFNGDGKLDLVSADLQGNAVSVLLWNGDGTFQARQAFATGIGPHSVSTGDFNGDGKLDLVSADEYGNTVSVLLGNGDGTFQARQEFAPGSGPFSVSTGDFNGDGKLDLVSADANDNTVSVLLGNGDGTFQARQVFGTGSAPISVSTGDFNGDGKLDLVSADEYGNTVSVLLGNGDGTFQARQAFATGSAPHSVSTGDFNGDGILDLVSADANDNTVSVLLGNGTTTTTQVGITEVSGISLATQSAALTAQGQIDSHFDNVNTISGIIGASISRFEIAAQVATTSSDAYQAAEGRIVDVDIASESANLTRETILQQAAASVLAQANQEPVLALRLLGQ